MLEELTGVELAAIPVAGAPLPWSLTMGSAQTNQEQIVFNVKYNKLTKFHRLKKSVYEPFKCTKGIHKSLSTLYSIVQLTIVLFWSN